VARTPGRLWGCLPAFHDNARTTPVTVKQSCLVLMAIIALGPLGGGAAAPELRPELSAPTYYIAARATYRGNPQELLVEGASNLPPGAVLYLNVYDSMQGGHQLNRQESAILGADGFFRVTAQAAEAYKFRHDIVCLLAFVIGSDPPQPPSVVRAVGSHGERLDFPRNPQAGVLSGENYYLRDYVHVP